MTEDKLVIGGKSFDSRLMVGTGKYKDFGIMKEAIAASGSQIVTVSIRRVEIGAAGHEGILEAIDLSRIQLLPNTAGCKTTEEAVGGAQPPRGGAGNTRVKTGGITCPKEPPPPPRG